jgi:hypothetical protein
MRVILVCAATVLVEGHLPIWEPERLHPMYARGGSGAGDYSLAHPLDLTDVGGETSVVIETLLAPTNRGRRDVDWMVYNKTTAAPETLFGFATTPACRENAHVTPSLTLAGPALPGGDRHGAGLPFPLPPGYAALTAREDPDAAPGVPRSIFTYGNASAWWMPPTYENRCLDAANSRPPHCSYSYAVNVNVTRPGLYYWAVWGPRGRRPQAVSVVLGFRERLDLILAAVPEQPPSNKVGLRGRCTPPVAGAYPVISA